MAHYFKILEDKCTGCLACVENCPMNALDFKDNGSKRVILHNMVRCARCGNCWRICPKEAIDFGFFLEDKWDEVVSLDLVKCEVCGEPIYTKNLENALEKQKDLIVPLCKRHKVVKAAASKIFLKPQ